MNLLYFTKKAALIGIALLAFSCKKGEEPIEQPVKGDFIITFKNHTTKAFFDGQVSGEACEKKLHNAVIFIFETGQSAQIFSRAFTSYELGIKTDGKDNPTAVISMPSGTFDASKTYDFYVLANHVLQADAITSMTRTALEALKYSDIASYNSTTFEGIFPESGVPVALRPASATEKGFAMSGSEKSVAPTADENHPRKVAIVISRNVSKLEAKAYTTKAFDDNYYKKYKSKITITSVTLKNVSEQCNVTEPTTFEDPTSYVSLVQTPKVVASGSPITDAVNDKNAYHNIFYLFENQITGGTVTAAKRVELVVLAKYDFNGSDETDNDISVITYTKLLDGVDVAKTGLITRNSYIKLDIKISGLTSNEVVADFTVKDWNAVVNQDIEFGS